MLVLQTAQYLNIAGVFTNRSCTITKELSYYSALIISKWLFLVSVVAGLYFSQSRQHIFIPVWASPGSKVTRPYALHEDIDQSTSNITCHIAHWWLSTITTGIMTSQTTFSDIFAMENDWLVTSHWLNIFDAFAGILKLACIK